MKCKVMETRESAVAGTFYKKEKEDLLSDLQNKFANASPCKQSNVRAVISPHAGYVYSGQIAASAINQIPKDKSYKRIFIIGSSHYYSYGKASVFLGDYYKTPLGKVPIDKEVAMQLTHDSEFIDYFPKVHSQEHSIEVQLPFLQFHLDKPFKIVPIIICSSNGLLSKEVASKLQPYFNQDNLFIISTDFSHYPSYRNAVSIDLRTAEMICENSASKLQNFVKATDEENKISTCLCGWTSVLTLLHLTAEEKRYKYTLIEYANSGDSIYGKKTGVVGYWAITVAEQMAKEFLIKESEKEALLNIARNSITNTVLKEDKHLINIPKKGLLSKKRGVFVSLYNGNMLRGCLGRFTPLFPLHESVRKLAALTATEDRRFEPIDESELADLTIEISLLSPMKKIESIDEIELGTHGIYIKKGYNAGTFLPHVATETGWNLHEFLGHCAQDKAQIGWNGWKYADIYTYEAVLFKGKM